jgi:hypothetical protein
MRRRGRVDGTQREIVTALRRLGVSVHSLADVGDGCPDLLVGYRGRTHLIEVKDGSKPPSARALTPLEANWHATWDGSPVLIWLGVPAAVRWYERTAAAQHGTVAKEE